MFNLTQIAMEGNILVSTLPQSINNLTNLLQINFRDNKLTGPLNSIIRSLNLTSYLVDRNMLSGPIPTEAFAPLNQLQYFSLFINKLTGTISPQLARMSSCQYFSVDVNLFHGTIPSEIGNIPSLLHLWVNDNNLESTLPRGLAQRENLELIMAQKNSKRHKRISYKLHVLLLSVRWERA